MPEADGDDAWFNQMLAEAMLNEANSSTSNQPATSSSAPLIFEPGPEITPEPDVQLPSLDFTPEPVVEPEVTPDPLIETPVVDVTPEPHVRPGPTDRPALQWPTAPASGASETNVPPVAVAPPVSWPPAQSTAFDDDTDEDLRFDDADDGTEATRGASTNEEDEEEAGFVRGLVEWVVVLVGAVIVALLLRAFLFQAFWIPSQSMEMTLLEQDRVLVNKLSYRLHDVNRGDVIVFRRPDEEQAEIRDLIKRVIGLPGEQVEARNDSIYIDGSLLIEPYLAPGESIPDFGPTLVPENEFFVMGDNRDESYDSRFFGTVSEDRIVGRAFILFWPLDRVGTL